MNIISMVKSLIMLLKTIRGGKLNMMPGIDPQMIAKARELGQNIKAKITIHKLADTVTLELTSKDPAAAAMIPNMIDQFADGLATQLQTFFAVKGEIIVIGKKE